MSNEPSENSEFNDQNVVLEKNSEPNELATTYEKKSKREKRTGIITLGITFIIIGIVSIYSLLFNNVWITAAKLSPLILIILGLEILIASYLKNFKFDFISCIICIILLFSTIGLSIFGNLYELFSKNKYFYQKSEPYYFEFHRDFDFD